jgi:hypothetical protein
MTRPLRRRPKIRKFDVTAGLPNLTHLSSEIQDYWDVLLGRVDPPIDAGVLTLMEVADAYYARAGEIAALILQKERLGELPRSSKYIKFRTGELRMFMEVAKRCADLGSRRVTAKQLEIESERTGRTRNGYD